MKMFKRLSLYFRPVGSFSFTVRVKIDNQDETSFSIVQTSDEDLLSTTFVLGSSSLGVAGVFVPVTNPIEGVGRGVQITVEDSTAGQGVEIYGISIEYEDADINQERV